MVPEAATARASAALGLAALRVDALQVGDQLVGELECACATGGSASMLVEDRGRLAAADCFANPAGNQLAQHRVQPADDWVRSRPRSW